MYFSLLFFFFKSMLRIIFPPPPPSSSSSSSFLIHCNFVSLFGEKNKKEETRSFIQKLEVVNGRGCG